MSVIITVVISSVALPAGAGLTGSMVAAAIMSAAASLGMRRKDALANVNGKPGVGAGAGTGNSVDLNVGNAAEVVGSGRPGESMTFVGDDLTVTFYRGAGNKIGVTVHGEKPEAELRALGEQLSRKVVQQYAYHRMVTEMRERNMNIVEEEVEEDGTVRMRVRLYQN